MHDVFSLHSELNYGIFSIALSRSLSLRTQTHANIRFSLQCFDGVKQEKFDGARRLLLSLILLKHIIDLYSQTKLQQIGAMSSDLR